MRSLLLTSFIAMLFLSSCDKTGIYEQNISIHDEKWSMDSIASFSPAISDSISAHNIYVNLRNTTSYPNSNIFLFITTHAPSGAMLRDTLECILANQKGDWLGKGVGRIRDNQIIYKNNIRFPSKGIYTFEIQHGMRTDVLKEVVSVGIRIELAQQQN